MLRCGCLHCGGQRHPAAYGEETSAQGCMELVDLLHTVEEAELQLETPRIQA